MSIKYFVCPHCGFNKCYTKHTILGSGIAVVCDNCCATGPIKRTCNEAESSFMKATLDAAKKFINKKTK